MADSELHTYASTSRFQYTTSSVRDEIPVGRQPPPHPRPAHAHSHIAPIMSTDSFAAPSILRPEYHKYFQPRRVEVVPGLQNDGRLTVRHPFVGRFLARTPSISPTDGRKPPAEAWWYKGMKKRSVSEVLDVGAELDEYQSECVFVLAALKVLHHPQHAKHFAFWGREPAPKTAERVQRVLREFTGFCDYTWDGGLTRAQSSRRVRSNRP